MDRYAAAAVHAYTAVGAVLALLMVHLAYAGDVRAVLWLFLVAMVIDGTDGFLARRLRVKEVLPQFDGALLDNIVDFLTYAFAPMVLLWSTGYLPGGAAGAVVAAVPVLASCYQFCRSDAKGPATGPDEEEDHYFLGFPSYWNIAAFYVVVVDLGQTATVVLLLVLTVLVFVPVRCVYPSRTLTLWWLNNILAAAWLAAWAVITALLPDPPTVVVVLSLVYVAYYTALSLWLTAQAARVTRADRAASSRSTSSAPV